MRAGTSTLCGVPDGSVGPTLRVSVVGVAGLAGGQLLTPPACTVLHQGQTMGSILAVGADGGATIGSTGFALIAGSGARSGTSCVGNDPEAETAGREASG